ncbi:glucokinase [Seminavis robusta]|uniref:Glucokinase n=1 Tax=Seminavis robusta TaxID=568900 RepID=A0A9N8HT38_9STRA|nr:glucokinase [Seminavis robusta]|eukprot:Sro1231_g254600.1 glucokinase (EC 2.7.1.2) (410) ;mRNA; r:9285-10754
MKTYLLTGDIGGTNSRMGLYSTSSPEPLKVKIYRNQDHLPTDNREGSTVFQDKIVAPFLKLCFEELSISPDDANNISSDFRIVACLACAGPVQNNKVRMSNLGYLSVDGGVIGNSSKPYLVHIHHCSVINDFVAQGYGCLTLQSQEVKHLYGPKSWPDSGPKVCVGAGTGLGECYLTPAVGSGIYSCFPSEGGHVEYTPRSDLEIKMLKYLREKFASKTRISVERVVSGIGLANVYEFLAQEYPDRVDKKVQAEFDAAGDDKGRVVATNAGPGSLCLEAMDLMMSAYGCEVGNAAIKFMPTGGLFVTGGLTPKNIKHIEGADTKFMQAYVDKGRVKTLLDTVPTFAVLTEDLGVRGAYKCAMMDFERICGASHEQSHKKDKDEKLGMILTMVSVAAAAYVTGAMLSKSK